MDRSRESLALPTASAVYGRRESVTAFCLGQPAHPVQAEEMVCRICGTLAAGALLGVYQIQQLLGSGRSGKAYLALHGRSRQPVAIKLLAPDPANVDLWEAARREVRVISSLRHNGILPVYSCTTWQSDGRAGVSATARPLHELMTDYRSSNTLLLTLCQYAPNRLTQFVAHYEKWRGSSQEQSATMLHRLIRLIQQAGVALSAAHARGVAHGALVPGNILLDGEEHLWLSDFGLARLYAPPVPYLPPELYAVSNACVQSGNMAAYWERVEAAGDQYMLGILCQQVFARLLQPTSYEHLQPILQCATNPQPRQRFASMDIFMHELIGQATGRRGQHGSGGQQFAPVRQERAVVPVVRSVRSASLTPDIRQQVLDPMQLQAYAQQQQQQQMQMYQMQQRQLTPIDNGPYAQAVNYGRPEGGPYLAPAVQASPADEWEKLGGKFFTSRNYDAAVGAYQKALEIDGNKPALWLALGDAFFALERWSEALKTYEQAMVLNPNDPLAWSNRGTALDALGRRKEAAECYERADQLRASLEEDS